MNVTPKWILPALLILVLGCTGPKISQDYNRSKDFSTLRTYRWQPASQVNTSTTASKRSFLDTNVRTAIERFLSLKGYQKIAFGTPDFLVGHEYGTYRTSQSPDVYTGIGIGGGSSGGFGGISIGTMGGGGGDYNQETLTITIYDPVSTERIWRGSSTRRVPLSSEASLTAAEAEDEVNKILAQFPPLP